MAKNILIIDDDADLSKEMADILGDEGHSVDVRTYTPENLPHFRPHDYDVIILDFKMPGLSGSDILKQIPQKKFLPKIFLVSGKPFLEKLLQEEKLLEKVTEIIQKPFPIQELLNKINAI